MTITFWWILSQRLIQHSDNLKLVCILEQTAAFEDIYQNPEMKSTQLSNEVYVFAYFLFCVIMNK